MDVGLYVRLLEAIAVLLSLDVLVFHFVAFQALLLPVELKVDVASCLCDRQFLIGQFHYFTLDVLVRDIGQLWIEMEVLSHNFIS